KENPTGTGEHDYALLLITGRTDETAKLPDSWSAIQIETTEEPAVGEQVFLGAYPAGFLGGIAVQRELYLLTSLATVTKHYTFTKSVLDVLGLGGNLLAQHGSSGGVVVNGEGRLIGLITLTQDAETTAARDLRAITLEHINRSFTEETAQGLAAFLGGDREVNLRVFQSKIAPTLTKTLTDVLERE
ncbi:MAG: hypothetical protein G01um101472_540, partial [Parcubacteria group bacterium Gr01-1014_72]